ncbi:hypothetical protein H6G33_17090 [Calothrix sp. FACHB-1219]|uniref:hypothetical protein n=1 Tax=unclassified Calothrix TaxID=2619626 RepID=UPI0016840933|nr:hypothetical protein [Calothrix sp. FACHB-168]MBD2203150.1 hypothetical protein [Calothrix sp. FACHB-168]MBD2218751.1 hypothetical protein [Calothrix sp. FACHB-1219]
MTNLGQKRLDAALTIATYSVGSATASAAPTFGGEIPKQILLTASDILMYTNIWKIYFAEDLSSKQLMEILTELGFVTVAGAGTAYVVSKVNTAILKEISNWMGPLGWGVVAAIAGSLSGLFGVAWAIYCDQLYAQKQPQ